jgi:23S rRNA pseudouridine2605 synthase
MLLRKKLTKNRKNPMLTRINKFIADSGITSRRKAEELITQGRVSVNNKLILELSYRINPDKDEVMIDGERIKVKQNVYYLLNKPKGVVSTTDDEKKRETVIDLIKTKEKIYPVGRLDYNTTGVLLITNDGEFSNLLTHPKNKVPRVYEVMLDKPLEDKDRLELLKGVFIDRRRGKFSSIKIIKPKHGKLVEVACVEGRNHFVKNMFETLGYNVKALNRRSFAGIIADIPVGTYRKLSFTEVNNLIKKYSKQK